MTLISRMYVVSSTTWSPSHHILKTTWSWPRQSLRTKSMRPWLSKFKQRKRRRWSMETGDLCILRRKLWTTLYQRWCFCTHMHFIASTFSLCKLFFRDQPCFKWPLEILFSEYRWYAYHPPFEWQLLGSCRWLRSSEHAKRRYHNVFFPPVFAKIHGQTASV